MIKVFSGLGESEDSPIESGVKGGIVYEGKPILGFLSTPADFVGLNSYKGTAPFPPDASKTTIQVDRSDVRKPLDIVDVPRAQADTGVRPQLYSADSGYAPFETLFHDFDLKVFPFYNFWTDDETSNDKDPLGKRKLEDVPRFFKVSWIPCPDLPDREVFPAHNVDVKGERTVMFSRGLELAKAFLKNGVTFSPRHLDPANFSLVKSVVADGRLAPGVIEAVVDLPLANTGVESYRTSNASRDNAVIDEDGFLDDPAFVGMAIQELRGQTPQVTNGVLSMASRGSPQDLGFVVSRPISAGGFVKFTGIQSSSPVISFDAATAVPSRQTTGDDVQDMLQSFSLKGPSSVVQSTVSTKVNFVDPSIDGLLDQSKINLMSAPEHVESFVALAPRLSSLEILSHTDVYDKAIGGQIPSLPSPKLKLLEYVGYIVQKYKRLPSGAFTLVEEFDLPSREIDFFIDTKVLYGEVYRYRIKAILRWTRPANVGVFGPDPSVSAVSTSQTSPLATHLSSYFSSEWCKSWAYATCVDTQPPGPPDELQVRPESHRKRVVVTCRIPENSQRDIFSMKILRRLQDENGVDLTDWSVVYENRGSAELKRPSNIIFFDTDVEYLQRGGLRYVYGAQAFSLHGEESFLSEQLVVTLNEEHFSQGENEVIFLSSAGVRREYFGAFSVRPPRLTKTEVVVTPPQTQVGRSPGRGVLFMSGRNALTERTLNDKKRVVRLTSLDTGEQLDLPFDVVFKTFPAKHVESTFDFHVPTHNTSNKNSDRYADEAELILRRELAKYQDAALVDDRGEDGEVFVYDRHSPGERW